MQRILMQLLAALAASTLLGSAGAANIYKWVDADGVTHYSDAAPDAAETTLIEVPEPVSGSAAEDSAADDDYYSITRQWERMYRERLEREKLEVERARIRAAQKAAEPTTVYVQQADETRYVPIYRGYGYRKHHRYKRHYPGPGIKPWRPAPAPSASWPTQ